MFIYHFLASIVLELVFVMPKKIVSKFSYIYITIIYIYKYIYIYNYYIYIIYIYIYIYIYNIYSKS